MLSPRPFLTRSAGRTGRVLRSFGTGGFIAFMLWGCPGELRDPMRFVVGTGSAGGAGGAGGSGCIDIEAELFLNRCGQSDCHSAETHAGSLDLVTEGIHARLAVQNATTSCGEAAMLNPDDPESSVLYRKLTESYCGPSRMPLGAPALTDSEMACLQAWIVDGGQGGSGAGTGATSTSSSSTSTSGSGGAAGAGGEGGSGTLDLGYLTEQLCPTPTPGHPAGTKLYVGGGGTEGRIAVTTDGATWDLDQTTVSMGTIEPGHTRNLIRGMGYGGGVFVAVGGHDNSLIDTSCDGVNWRRDVLGTNVDTDPTSALSAFISDVAYKDGIFIGAGANGARFISTDHGYTWSRVPVATYGGHLRGVAAGNGVFVAVGASWNNDQPGVVTTSADGITWTAMVESPGGLDSGIVFGNGRFVAYGADRCVTSTDGLSWSDCTTLAHSINHLSFSNQTFYLDYQADGWLSSSDAITWSSSPGWLPSTYVFGDGLYVRISNSYRGYSSDFMNWTDTNMDGSGIGNMAFGEVLYDPNAP